MIERWFATPIYYEKLLGIDNDSLIKRAYLLKEKYNKEVTTGWKCNTFNTLGRENMVGDSSDQPLYDIVNTVGEHVEYFASELGADMNNLKTVAANYWFNIAGPGAFQESHQHTNSHFSAVYYPKEYKQNSGNLLFQNLTSLFDSYRFHICPQDSKYSGSISDMIEYQPYQGLLVIFRSYLPHMVEINRSSEDRISMSFNFSLLEK